MKNNMINFIKNIAFFSINIYRGVLFRLFTLLPVKNNFVFVNCFDGKGISDNPKYIFLQLKQIRPNLKFFWTYSKNEKSTYSNSYYVKAFSIKAIYYQARSKIWVSTVRMPYYATKRKRQQYVHTWHGGLGIKKIEQECEDSLSSRYIRTAKHDSKMIDYYISPNEDTSKLYLNNFWYSGGKICKYGSARNDIFFSDAKLQAQHVISKLKLDPQKKTVLYAPTFRKNNRFDEYNIDFRRLTSSLSERFGGEWQVVVRLHPRLSNSSGAYMTNHPSVFDGSMVEDVQDLLVATDALITDYSSIGFDFMCTNRPIFLYATDIETYRRDRDFHVPLEKLPFSLADSNSSLCENIAGFDAKSYAHRLESFRNEYGLIDDGKASIRTAKLINLLVEG